MSKKIHSQDSNSNWREEYKNTHRVTKRQLELLENGPDSLSASWSLNAMYQQWRQENNK
jgi:hypothetical protein